MEYSYLQNYNCNLIDTITRNITFWSGRRDSNPQQPAWKAGTLPIELLPHLQDSFMYYFQNQQEKYQKLLVRVFIID